MTKLWYSDTDIMKVPKNLNLITHLKVDCCDISVILPHIADMINLETLKIIRCNLKYIPQTWGKLRSLKTLFIDAYNHDDDLDTFIDIPTKLFEITTLTAFTIFNWRIMSIHDDIGKLINLTILRLSSLRITSLPESIQNLHKLIELDCSYNKLETIPTTINQLINLEIFNVSNNALQKIPPLTNLSNLRLLYVDNNQLMDLMLNTACLKLIDMSYNPMTKLPDDIYTAKHLDHLYAEECSIETLSPLIANLRELEVLNLRDDELKTLPDEICKLTNLQSLQVSNNQLTILPLHMGRLKKLILLNIGGNNISSLPMSIYNLKKLEQLHISSTDISFIHPNINNLRRLDWLSMSNTDIRVLPPMMHGDFQRHNISWQDVPLIAAPSQLFKYMGWNISTETHDMLERNNQILQRAIRVLHHWKLFNVLKRLSLRLREMYI